MSLGEKAILTMSGFVSLSRSYLLRILLANLSVCLSI